MGGSGAADYQSMNKSAIRRLGGLVMVAGSVGQLIAAWLPDPRVFTSSDARVQLEAIAKRPWGWKAQAVGFPIAFAVTGVGIAAVASTMPEPRPRSLAKAATLLSVLSVVLWLPITVRRLTIGRRIDALISEQPTVVNIGGPTFWPYTVATLGSIVALSCSLVVAGLHRRFATVTGALSGVAMMLLRKFRDWPPFLSYVITLAIGLRIAWPRRPVSPARQQG
jgi:hypothetical protein